MNILQADMFDLITLDERVETEEQTEYLDDLECKAMHSCRRKIPFLHLSDNAPSAQTRYTRFSYLGGRGGCSTKP